MRVRIAEAEDRVWFLHRDHLEAPQNAGFVNLPDSIPHIVMRHVIERLKSYYLKPRMSDIVA